MRRVIAFDCMGEQLAGTHDEGHAKTGLLIVSGGSEIRAGAHAGQAQLAAKIAASGFPVFRYDRRGIGDSEGENQGFESTAADIAAACEAFRAAAPNVKRIIGFGNCDAATALALFHHGNDFDGLLLANPWVIEVAAAQTDAPTPPSAAAIRARYWARIKNPRSLLDLLTGKINLAKLVGGLARAAQQSGPNRLADQLATALSASNVPVKILIAKRDTTAMAFMGEWNGPGFAALRQRADIQLASTDTASHSFADERAKSWLLAKVIAELQRHKSDGIGSGGGT